MRGNKTRKKKKKKNRKRETLEKRGRFSLPVVTSYLPSTPVTLKKLAYNTKGQYITTLFIRIDYTRLIRTNHRACMPIFAFLRIYMCIHDEYVFAYGWLRTKIKKQTKKEIRKEQKKLTESPSARLPPFFSCTLFRITYTCVLRMCTVMLERVKNIELSNFIVSFRI